MEQQHLGHAKGPLVYYFILLLQARVTYTVCMNPLVCYRCDMSLLCFINASSSLFFYYK